jgi:hypothetical protein
MTKTDQKLSAALMDAKLPGLAGRALAGEFSDFRSPHAMPKVTLVKYLRDEGTPDALVVAKRVMNGEFDD